MSSNVGGFHNCGSRCGEELPGVAAWGGLACGPRPELEFGLNMRSRMWIGMPDRCWLSLAGHKLTSYIFIPADLVFSPAFCQGFKHTIVLAAKPASAYILLWLWHGPDNLGQGVVCCHQIFQKLSRGKLLLSGVPETAAARA